MAPREFRFAAVRVIGACGMALLTIVTAAMLPMPALSAAARPQDQQTNEEEFGRDAYRPGRGGVTIPSVLKRVDPTYTQAAMDAKIQGIVMLEAVIEASGKIDKVRVRKSLDTQFGLDQSAVDAARQWIFEPATLNGKKVAVIVELQMEFKLR